MEQNFIQHGDDFIVITGNVRCTNADCPYINEVGDCPGDIENCEYRQQRNDAFLGIRLTGSDRLEYCKEIWLVCCVNKDKISEFLIFAIKII